MLKHDSGGFLVGEPINPSDLSSAIEVWEKIRDDVSSIKGMLSSGKADALKYDRTSVAPVAKSDKAKALSVAQPSKAPKAANDDVALKADVGVEVSVGGRSVVAVEPIKDAATGSGSRGAAESQAIETRVAAAQPNEEPRSIRKPKADGGQDPRRDASGRFVKVDEKDDGGSKGLFAEDNAAQKIGKAVAEATRGADEVDPAIKAFHEVMTPVAGVTSAISGLGGNKDPERRAWFRRIFGEIKSFREEETAYSKAAAKSLKGIEKKPKEGGGIISLLVSLFARFLPMLAGILPMLGGLGALGGGGLLGGLAGSLWKGGKGLLKRVPILGALLSGADGLMSIFSSETDDSLTRGEKDVKTGGAAGGIMGSIAGMWAGAKLGAAVGALGGPIGAAIGGVVGGAAGMFFGDEAGQLIGETVGGWVAALRDADIAGFFKEKWSAITDGIGAAWDSVTGFFSEKWEASVSFISDTFNDVMTSIFGERWADIASWISEKWVDITDNIASRWEATTELFSKAWTAVTGLIGDFFGGIGDKILGAADTANAYIEEKTGVNIKESVSSTIDKVSETVENTKKAASDAVDSIKKGALEVSDSVKSFFGFGGGSEGTGGGGRSGGGGATDGWRSGGGKGDVSTFKTGTKAEGKAALMEAMEQAGMSDEEKAALMGNVAAESGFVPQSENLAAYKNTSNERIRKIFVSKTRGMSDEQLTALKQDPEKFGNHVYSHLGGYKYRGRGHIQLTGIDNYRRYSRQVFGDDRLVDNPEMANDPKVAAQLAVAYQKDRAHPLARKLYGKDFNDLSAEQMQHVTTQAVAGEGNNLNKGYLADLTRKKQGYANSFLTEIKSGAISSDQPTDAPSSEPPSQAKGLLSPTAESAHDKAAVVTAPQMAAIEVAAPQSEAVTAHAPSVSVAAYAPTPMAEAPPAPAVHAPLGSSSGKDQQQVVVDAPDAGQDLMDRGIAHIVTGGIGAK